MSPAPTTGAVDAATGSVPAQASRATARRVVPGRHRPGHVSSWLAAPSLAGLALLLLYPTVFVLLLAFTKSSLARPLQRWTGTDNLVDAAE